MSILKVKMAIILYRRNTKMVLACTLKSLGIQSLSKTRFVLFTDKAVSVKCESFGTRNERFSASKVC